MDGVSRESSSPGRWTMTCRSCPTSESTWKTIGTSFLLGQGELRAPDRKLSTISSARVRASASRGSASVTNATGSTPAPGRARRARPAPPAYDGRGGLGVELEPERGAERVRLRADVVPGQLEGAGRHREAVGVPLHVRARRDEVGDV